MFKQEICEKMFKKKYMLHGEKSVKDVFKGIAKEVSSVEKENVINKIFNKKPKQQYWEKTFYNLLSSLKFIPAGRIVANARPYSKNKYYNNCYTSPIKDSMSSIYDSIKNHALISQSGGGNGITYSELRPSMDELSRGGYASGPVSFMKVFNTSGKIIMTGGNRRNAQIALLTIEHPDIEKFITCKQGEDSELDQMNISASVINKFMEAVKKDKKFKLTYKGKTYKELKAVELFETLTKNAYQHNEPGIFFVDKVNEDNNCWEYLLNSVNPCGELPLPSEGGVCNLGAMNLTQYVVDPFTENSAFDIESFVKDVVTAVRFLDNVIDATKFPLENIKKMQQNWRRIGLGYTGLADCFIMMGVKYGSEKSLKITEIITKTLRDTSYTASALLSKEKGSFKKYNKRKLFAKEKSMVRKLPDYIKKNIRKYGLRNIGLNTIAPTGTTSLTLGNNCSSGIEPVFNFLLNRNILNDDGSTSKFEIKDYAYMLYREMIDKEGDLPDYFTTTLDLDPYRAIDVQAVAQKYIDHSISRTINLPLNYSYEKYKDLFMYAYDQGCKGLTTFNPQGSMSGILEHTELDHVTRRISPERPEDLECDVHRLTVQGVEYLVLVGKLNGTLYEVFVAHNKKTFDFNNKTGIIKKKKRGHYSLIVNNEEYFHNIIDEMDGKDHEQTIARFISMALRHGTPLQFIVSQLNREKNFVGFSKCISRVIKKYIKEGEIVATSERCPECGEKLVFKDGCKSCSKCVWSKCE